VIGPFSYDLRQIPGADHGVCEISKRDFWFDHYHDKMRETEFAREVIERDNLNQTFGNKEIALTHIRQPGYYDFRIFAVDRRGKVVGCCSDSITLWIEPRAGHSAVCGKAKD
jgi:hypothetical protein